MATKVHSVSTLNPNAPLFVPSAYRVVEDFSSEWWNLVQTCPEFREQWVREWLPVLEEQMFEADLEEIADLDEFLEFQDEVAQESFHFDVVDGECVLFSSAAMDVSAMCFFSLLPVLETLLLVRCVLFFYVVAFVL